MFKKTAFVSVSLVVSAISILSAAAADRAPARDYRAQFGQVAEAMLGQAPGAESGSHFYQGRDREGGACLASVSYNAHSVSVELKGIGSRNQHRDTLDVNVPDASRDITSIEVNSNSRFLGVAIQQEITPYRETRVDHYAYQLRAEIDDSARGLGRVLSVSASRDEKGEKASEECDDLRPVLALNQAAAQAAGERAIQEYIRQNPDDAKRDFSDLDVETCVMDKADAVTCDVSIATDYTPDTLHVTFEVRDGALGAAKKFDYEPGC